MWSPLLSVTGPSRRMGPEGRCGWRGRSLHRRHRQRHGQQRRWTANATYHRCSQVAMILDLPHCNNVRIGQDRAHTTTLIQEKWT